MIADYIGWAGNGNLGDDACFQAIQRLCAPAHLRQSEDPSAGLCILGGGTLLYGDAFLASAAKAQRRGAKIAVFGSGVDLSVPLDDWEPQRRQSWRALLADAVVVGVRGPDSLEAVRKLGAKAPVVVGDPALTLGSARPPNSGNHQHDLVLLSAGTDFPPDGGRLHVVSVLAETVQWLRGVGLRVQYLPLRPNDLVYGRMLIERFGLPVVPCSLRQCLGHVRRAHLVISLRLHGAVFAAAYGVPFVSLDYRPKCRDFARSVGMDRYCLRTRTLEFPALRRAIERIDAQYDAMAKRLGETCNEYRRRQIETAAAMVDATTAARDPATSERLPLPEVLG